MHSRSQLMLLLACLAGGAVANQPIEHRPVPAYVVAEAVLPVSAPILRAALLKGLSVNEERNDPVYMTSGFVSRDAAGREAWAPVLAEESAKALFGKEYFRDPDHAKDLYVHFMGQPIVSSYYYADGKALDYGVIFSIAIDSIGDSKSKVSIRTVKSEVFIGKALNLHAMGLVPKSEAVPDSPLDQYKMLAYVAHLVGVQLAPVENEIR